MTPAPMLSLEEIIRYMYENMHATCKIDPGRAKAHIHSSHPGLKDVFGVVHQWWRSARTQKVPVHAWLAFHALVLGIHDEQPTNELENAAMNMARTYGVFTAQEWWTRAQDYNRIVLPSVLEYSAAMRQYLPRI